MEAQAWQHSPPPRFGGLLQSLTGREIEVLDLAGSGLSMKAIAQVLGISAGTVSWHLKNAYQKLGVGCRDDALRKARAQKIIRPANVAGHVCPVCSCQLV